MEIKNNIYTKRYFTSLKPQDMFEVDGRVFMKVPELTLKNDSHVNAYCLMDDTYVFIGNDRTVQMISSKLKETPFSSLGVGTVFLKYRTPYIKVSETEVYCFETNVFDSFKENEMVAPVKSTLTLDVP